MTVATSGSAAHGALVLNGGRISGTNVSLIPSGADAMALYAVGEIGPASNASFTDSRLVNP